MSLILFVAFVSAVAVQVNETLQMPSRHLTRYDPNYLSTRQLTFLRLPGESADYVLRPGDLMEVSVVGFDYTVYTVRISASGQMSLPFVGVLGGG